MLDFWPYFTTPTADFIDLQVLYANAHPSMAHTSPEFIPVFGDCIRMIRDVLYTKDAQPFLVSGSGTLGWDQVSWSTSLKSPIEYNVL